jgi:hypothetical protein
MLIHTCRRKERTKGMRREGMGRWMNGQKDRLMVGWMHGYMSGKVERCDTQLKLLGYDSFNLNSIFGSEYLGFRNIVSFMFLVSFMFPPFVLSKVITGNSFLSQLF